MIPVMERSVVVLPAPLGATDLRVSPDRTVKLSDHVAPARQISDVVD
jgi:hypothetical protein